MKVDVELQDLTPFPRPDPFSDCRDLFRGILKHYCYYQQTDALIERDLSSLCLDKLRTAEAQSVISILASQPGA